LLIRLNRSSRERKGSKRDDCVADRFAFNFQKERDVFSLELCDERSRIVRSGTDTESGLPSSDPWTSKGGLVAKSRHVFRMYIGKMHTVELRIPMHQRVRQGNKPVDLWVFWQIETMKTPQLYRVS
jgi:hypothetical protein